LDTKLTHSTDVMAKRGFAGASKFFVRHTDGRSEGTIDLIVSGYSSRSLHVSLQRQQIQSQDQACKTNGIHSCPKPTRFSTPLNAPADEFGKFLVVSFLTRLGNKHARFDLYIFIQKFKNRLCSDGRNGGATGFNHL
jgi:hypothetical protein